MLSILIPVYNFDVRKLVADLHHQCIQAGIVFEIMLYDDLSDIYFRELNQSVAELSHVQYHKLDKNLGRSSIRNALGRAAQYDALLFMDCDSKVVQADYIKNYINLIDGKSVLYGGRCYDEVPPEEKVFYFHWYYGKNREEKTAQQRAKQPYHAFMTNNFLIPRSVFLEILFNEQIRQYGHEDTLFGMALAERQVPIIHLDNPLEHIGLEKGDVFLQKTESGLKNLIFLRRNGIQIHTKLLRTLDSVEKTGLVPLMSYLAKKRERRFLENLNGNKTRLWEFDLWKLGKLIVLEQESL